MAKFSTKVPLYKIIDFSAALSVKPQYSQHFFVYVKKNNLQQTRLGLVIGKRVCKYAVQRNLIKRIAREVFRKNCVALQTLDVLLRLRKSFDLNGRKLNSRKLKANCLQEFLYLIEKIKQNNLCQES